MFSKRLSTRALAGCLWGCFSSLCRTGTVVVESRCEDPFATVAGGSGVCRIDCLIWSSSSYPHWVKQIGWRSPSSIESPLRGGISSGSRWWGLLLALRCRHRPFCRLHDRLLWFARCRTSCARWGSPGHRSVLLGRRRYRLLHCGCAPRGGHLLRGSFLRLRSSPVDILSKDRLTGTLSPSSRSCRL